MPNYKIGQSEDMGTGGEGESAKTDFEDLEVRAPEGTQHAVDRVDHGATWLGWVGLTGRSMLNGRFVEEGREKSRMFSRGDGFFVSSILVGQLWSDGSMDTEK